jgi:GDP-mannose 6-dehydrogenase
MKIAVFGMGYVGVVTAACFADDGHDVVGVDTAAAKAAMVNGGQSPIVEEGIAELVQRCVASGRLRAVTDGKDALRQVDIAIICVGTPSRADGALDHGYVLKVCEEIGAAIRERTRPIVLVFRSTMVPGSMRGLVLPALEKSCGAPAGRFFRAVFHPEFLREGTSVKDFYEPPKIVVGADSEEDARAAFALYPPKYAAPRITCSIEVAEMVKYTDNVFHAVKITFANEIGQFCHAHGIDSHEVMQIFCQDTKLNISPYYLKPGFAFGGSCLPKDLRAFLSEATHRSLSLPMLQGVLPSNRHQLERVLAMVLALNPKKVGFYGLAFKQGTDDLRESPYVELAERLMGKGKDLLFYDREVHVSRLIGRNKSFIENAFPHLSRVLTEDINALESCDLVLLSHRPPDDLVRGWLERGVRLLDLTGSQRRKASAACFPIV